MKEPKRVSQKLSRKDYITILQYYNTTIPENTKLSVIREKAEHIIALKLCKCIKKVDVNSSNEAKAIAICNKSVIQDKDLKIHRFTCKKRPRLLSSKNNKTRMVRKTFS